MEAGEQMLLCTAVAVPPRTLDIPVARRRPLSRGGQIGGVVQRHGYSPPGGQDGYRVVQRELCVRAGLDPSVASPRINQYERGKHTPDTGTLAKLGEVLEVPVAYFLPATMTWRVSSHRFIDCH